MAGLGSRFAKAGYADPKPMININGVPMIQAVVDNINISGKYIFIVQLQHFIKYNLDDLLRKIAPDCEIILIDGITDGAARTVLEAKQLIDNDMPLIIANSDQIVEWDSKKFIECLKDVDGVIATFNASDPKWSYVKTNLGKVLEVAEKRVISNEANVGIYAWAKGSDYVKYAEQMIKKNITTNNEFYIAPVYNEAILDNKIISTYSVNKMHGIGTPEDLVEYLKKENV